MSIIRFVAEDIRRFNALAGPEFFELLMVLVQFSNSTGYYNHDDDLGDLERELAKVREAAGMAPPKATQAQKKKGSHDSDSENDDALDGCADYESAT
jgi:hypothetical protein